VELGLIQKAIDVLLASHLDLYGAEGLELLLDLCLRTGRAADARALLDRSELRSHPEVLGVYTIPGKPHADGQAWSFRFMAYDWHVLCEKAAVGRYDGAREALQQIDGRFSNDERSIAPALTRELSRHIGIEVGFGTPGGSLLMRLLGGRNRVRLQERVRQIQLLTVTRGDLATLGAVLELERGNASSALEQCEAGLALYTARKGSSPVLPGQPLAARLVEAIRRQRH
jgi:hypothetical protein